MSETEEFIIKLIKRKHPSNGGVEIVQSTDGRFWIDVLDSEFDGDFEKGDPILEQYVLVPVSKIQDRLDIRLDFLKEAQ